MSPDQSSSKTPNVNRDTILLIATIALLGLAVGLTFTRSPRPTADAQGVAVSMSLQPSAMPAAAPAAPVRRERPTISPTAAPDLLAAPQRQQDGEYYPEPYPGEDDGGDMTADEEMYPYPAEETPPGFEPTFTGEDGGQSPETDGEAAAENGGPTATIGAELIGTTPQNVQLTAAAIASTLIAVTPTPTVTPLPSPTPLPTSPPARILTGSNRWSAADSPIILDQDVVLAPNAELIIEPGVEIRLAAAASIYLDGGRLLAVGSAERRIVFTGATGMRWGGIFARPGSFVALENVVVRGGGIGGTVMLAEEAGVVLRYLQVTDNGGGVIAYDALLTMEYSEIAGNDVPYGAALDISYVRGNGLTLVGNRIGGNRLGDNAPMVRITSGNPREVLNLELRGNLIRGGTPNLALNVETHMQGTIVCNALLNGGPGLSLRSSNAQIGPNGSLINNLRVARNIIDGHVPPIEPVYTTYGLGRGAISDIGLDMHNNYWGDSSGPYHPDFNPAGRGDSVGSNIVFAPWLDQPPPCAPAQ